MQVFVFDWMAYGQDVDKFRVNGEMPKLGRKQFDPQVAVETYRNHLAAWVEMEKQGFDGIAINEHHSTPFGLNNSPNLIAAAISQLTTKLKILLYANLLPLHDPLPAIDTVNDAFATTPVTAAPPAGVLHNVPFRVNV